MAPETTPSSPPAPKLLDQVRDRIQVKDYSIGTETKQMESTRFSRRFPFQFTWQ